MAKISAIRDGLAARLATIPGLRVHDLATGQITPPAAVLLMDSPAITFDTSMSRGSDDLNFRVLLLVSSAVDRAAQQALDAYLDGSGPNSVKQALEADQDLDGAAHWTTVTEVRDYGLVEWASVQYLGASVIVRVGVLGAS